MGCSLHNRSTDRIFVLVQWPGGGGGGDGGDGGGGGGNGGAPGGGGGTGQRCVRSAHTSPHHLQSMTQSPSRSASAHAAELLAAAQLDTVGPSGGGGGRAGGGGGGGGDPRMHRWDPRPANDHVPCLHVMRADKGSTGVYPLLHTSVVDIPSEYPPPAVACQDGLLHWP